MRRALAVAALLVLAGCGGAPSAGETLTPAPIPRAGDAASTPAATAGPDAEPTVLSAGPRGTGGPAPFALAGAHADALANRSFTVVRTLVVRDGNGTLRRVNRTARVAPGGAPYHFVQTASSAPGHPVSAAAPRLAVWYDGRTAAYRVGSPNGSARVGLASEPGDPVGDLDAEQRLVALYAGFDDWNGACTPDGCRFVAGGATGTDPLDVPVLVARPTNASLRLRLAPGGRVERLRLRYDGRFDGRPVTVVRELRFVAVGDTAVRRPAWVAAAANRSGAAPGEGSKEPL